MELEIEDRGAAPRRAKELWAVHIVPCTHRGSSQRQPSAQRRAVPTHPYGPLRITERLRLARIWRFLEPWQGT